MERKGYYTTELMLLSFYDFEPRIIIKLFLKSKGVILPKCLRNVFQSLLMFYYIIKLRV